MQRIVELRSDTFTLPTDSMRRAMAAAGLEPDIRSALPRFLELYDERLLVHTRLYEGMREALETLYRRAEKWLGTLEPPPSLRRSHDEYLAAVRLFQRSAVEARRLFAKFWPEEFPPN